jgi:hypothetical protein
MFRLLKLLAWIALGYVAYQLYQGMSGGGGGDGGGERRRGGRRSRLERALNEDQGRMNMTGPGRGRGTRVATEDSQGGRSNRLVGRGVVSE